MPRLRSEVLSKQEGGQYLLGYGPAHSPHLPPLKAAVSGIQLAAQ